MDENKQEFFLEGNLLQMGEQRDFLQEQGFRVGKVGVYPTLSTEQEYNEAIRLIWEHKVSGWFHYRLNLIETGVCTNEEFSQSLKEND